MLCLGSVQLTCGALGTNNGLDLGTSGDPTEHFVILEPQNLSIDASSKKKISCSKDFENLKL